jgi:hypothetical protein
MDKAVRSIKKTKLVSIAFITVGKHVAEIGILSLLIVFSMHLSLSVNFHLNFYQISSTIFRFS